jgi:hypothetical protein
MKRKIVSDSELIEAVRTSFSVYEVLRKIGKKEAGGNHAHYSRKIKQLNADTSHFLRCAHNKGKSSPKKRKPDSILTLRTSGGRTKARLLVRAMLESNVKHECSKCGQKPEWLGSPLTLDVDHVNKNWLDDRLENLRFLCPNCHSQFSRNLLGN